MTKKNKTEDEEWAATLTTLPDDYLDYWISRKSEDVEDAKNSLARQKFMLNAFKKEKARRAK